jgi:predicted DNA-binding transcriptional regulator AlpA
MSESSVWKKSRSGAIPKPVKIEGFTRWRRSEIDKYVESLTAS